MVRGACGGIARGQDNRGDLLSAYYEQLNTYICDAAGLHGWNYNDYRSMQRQNMGGVRLGDAYKRGL